jgi:outer membrane receptor protein involved in Fe transport
LNDIERVEALLGPQGTLYGAGTMAGAIRYIPKRPEFDTTDVQVRGSTYGYSDESSLGGDGGATVNLPISETLAFRGSYDYRTDPASLITSTRSRHRRCQPDPDFSDPADVAANLKQHKGANDVQTRSVALRCAGSQPTRSTRPSPITFSCRTRAAATSVRAMRLASVSTRVACV